MSAIAGIVAEEQWELVRSALRRVCYRGSHGDVVVSKHGATLGEIHFDGVKMWLGRTGGCRAVCAGVVYNWREVAEETLDVDQALDVLYQQYGPQFVKDIDGAFAVAIAGDDGLFLARDPLGVAPLYYGERDGRLCFASEVKALLAMTDSVTEFPPGHYYHPSCGFVQFFDFPRIVDEPQNPVDAAHDLRKMLGDAVSKCVAVSDSVGCWLSGGLDSSTIAALACLHSPKLDTFAVGVAGCSDLEYARAVARHIGSRHHELLVTGDQLLHVLPEVIYHLESFDALLVRSSLTNYLLAGLASDHVRTVLSGEGGDELFAGYDYLVEIEPSRLQDELRLITLALHNTALQRVDRCSAAHGITAHVPFLDRQVVRYAFSLPVHYKLRRNGRTVGKWILRRSASSLLPPAIVERPKAKFWQGAGVLDLVAQEAERAVSDADLEAEKRRNRGPLIRTKEELLYFRMFREQFGDLGECEFIGRTRVAA